MIKWEWYLTVPGKGKELFLSILLHVMEKAAYLRESNRAQIIMARRFGMSSFITARLVGCSLSAIVSIYAKWINDSETSSKYQDPHANKERGHRRLSHLVQQNQHQTMSQFTAQYNAGPSARCFKTFSSADTVEYGSA
ncbi:hypothetical protein X975_13761, partial [Stegodyphus mimosarum]